MEFYTKFGYNANEVIFLKKIFLFIVLSFSLFSKSFTLSLGIENSGKLQSSNYISNGNPRFDIEYLHYFNKLGVGFSGGINFLNIEEENYSLMTNVSVNGALKLIQMENYYIYTQLNLGYSYSFITTYHMDNNLQSVEPNLYNEIKLGMIYNDFNINIGISTVYLKLSENNKSYNDSLSRLSINLGFLIF